MLRILTVSIPYRYSKNEEGLQNLAQFLDEFQFLIGTLKIFRQALRGHDPDGVSIPYRYSKNIPWQFFHIVVFRVSIPYRYSKNSSFAILLLTPTLFQFLIGTLKTCRLKEEFIPLENCFNSL